MAEKKKGKKGGIEILTPFGIVLAAALIIISMLISADWAFSGVLAFVDAPSLLIVVGGTLAGILIAFRSEDIIFTLKKSSSIINRKQENLDELLEMFVEFSKKVKKNGFLSLEESLAEIDDAFIKKGIELILSGSTDEEIKEIMTTELNVEVERLGVAPGFWAKMAEMAPGFGMIGTFVGLVIMLGNMDDASSLGPAMAVAMITTFYGSVIANVVGSPLANKTNRSIDLYYNEKVFIIEAICELQQNPTPSKLRIKLEAHIPKESSKKKKKGKEAEAKEAA